MELKVRMIGVNNCPKCEIMKEMFASHGLNYEFYDADLPEHEQQLDEWMIEDMPVIQIVDDSGNVKFQFIPGLVSVKAIRFKMDKILKGQH